MTIQLIGDVDETGDPLSRRASEAIVLQAAAREAVARAWANGSFLIVRDTARRIAGAGASGADERREERMDAASRFLIEECARRGVSMLFDARDATERLRRDGQGSVVAL